MSEFEIFCIGTVAALLGVVWVIINEKRRRRLAQARLQIAKDVTRMEELMLCGDMKSGEACHDHLFKFMLKTELNDSYEMSFKLLRLPTKQEEEFRNKLKRELATNNPEIKKIFRDFEHNYFRAFENSRPIAFSIFTCKRLICTGAIFALLWTAFLLVIGVRKIMDLKKRWKTFRAASAETSVAYQMQMARA